MVLLLGGSGKFSFIAVYRRVLLTKFEPLARILSALKKPRFVTGTETFGSTRERNASMRNDFLGRPIPCLCVRRRQKTPAVSLRLFALLDSFLYSLQIVGV